MRTLTHEFSAAQPWNSRFEPSFVIPEVDAVWIGGIVKFPFRDVRTVHLIDAVVGMFVALHFTPLIDDLPRSQQPLSEETDSETKQNKRFLTATGQHGGPTWRDPTW